MAQNWDKSRGAQYNTNPTVRRREEFNVKGFESHIIKNGKKIFWESDIYALYRPSRSPLATPSRFSTYEDEDETPLLVSKLSSEPSSEIDVYNSQIIVEKGSLHSFIHVTDKNKKVSPEKSTDLPQILDSVLSIKIPKALLNDVEDEVIKAYVLHTKPLKGRKMNLYEAFGVTSKLRTTFLEQPLIVVEIFRSGILKRFQVPHKYSLKTKWILYGRHIYVYMGHSFVEFRSSPNLMSMLMCIFPRFKAYQDYYRCLDCNFTCLQIGEEAINPCPMSRILTEEMNFPYD